MVLAKLVEHGSLESRALVNAGAQRCQVRLNLLDADRRRGNRHRLTSHLRERGLYATQLSAQLAHPLQKGRVTLAIVGRLEQAEILGHRRAHLGLAPVQHADAALEVRDLRRELRLQPLHVLVHVGG